MKDVLFLETLEQIKAISHPHRMAILKSFASLAEVQGEDAEFRPLTIKMIAEEMDETPSKLHYHVKELEKTGILEVVDTREINGILERFYLPVAERITIKRDLLKFEDSSDPYFDIVFGMLDNTREHLNKLKSRLAKEPDDELRRSLEGQSGMVALTNDQREEFVEEFMALCDKYSKVSPGARPYDLLVLLYPHTGRMEDDNNG